MVKMFFCVNFMIPRISGLLYSQIFQNWYVIFNRFYIRCQQNRFSYRNCMTVLSFQKLFSEEHRRILLIAGFLGESLLKYLKFITFKYNAS